MHTYNLPKNLNIIKKSKKQTQIKFLSLSLIIGQFNLGIHT